MITGSRCDTGSTWGSPYFLNGMRLTYTSAFNNSTTGTDTTSSDNVEITYTFVSDSVPRIEYEEPVWPAPPAPWERFPCFDEGQRWVPKAKLRDNRKNVWACRPRHGLSGR